MEYRLPKVLVVSTNAWRDNTGINTLIEFFKAWDTDRLAQVYTKSALPKTRVCNRFFRISENAVIKSILNRRLKTGAEVENETVVPDEEQAAIDAEKRLYAQGSKKQSWFLRCCREAVWRLGKWRTAELDKFIAEFDADVLFLPIYPTVYMGSIQKYIINKTKKPAVCYLADDNYTYKPCGKNLFALAHRFFLRRVIRSVVGACSRMLVISPRQKEEYDKLFGVNSQILTKGIDYSQLTYTEKPVGSPVRMVYTGKLIIGRWKSLAAIAAALAAVNADATRMTLDIYTTDLVTKAQSRLLNRNGCRIRGAVSLGEVAKIQEQADILVFAESLDKKYKDVARLSFSTKLTDYMRAGKCILAVGCEDIAPIDYFIRNDSAVVVSRESAFEEKLRSLSENPKMISAYAKKAFECGRLNHDRDTMHQRLINVICEVSENGTADL